MKLKDGFDQIFKKMKVTDHLKKAKETLFSYEILPPLKGASIQSIYDTLDPLIEFNPPFIDVTYHREEYIYENRKDGLLEKKSVRKRPGTVGICAAIMNKYNVDTVPHIICGGFTQEETENALIDLDFLGIDNLLVLRGDPIKSETYFTAEKGGHKYASDLIKQVDGLNKGIYLDENLKKQSLDAVITPTKNLELPLVGSFVKGADVIPKLINKFNPKYILSSTIGGDAKYSGFLNNFISVQDYEEELDCNLVDLKSMQSIMI